MIDKKIFQNISKALFDSLIECIKFKIVKPEIKAKRTCVDMQVVLPEEEGTIHTVWENGKIKERVILDYGMVLLTVLNKYGKPVVDKMGHKTVYVMTASKFDKEFPKFTLSKHYISNATPHYVVNFKDIPFNIFYNKIDKEVFKFTNFDENYVKENGITFFPPNWNGHTGTIVKEGMIMFPYYKNLSLEEHVKKWEEIGYDKLDWYPNNNPKTYAKCNKNGNFEDENLRKLFGQSQEITETMLR